MTRSSLTYCLSALKIGERINQKKQKKININPQFKPASELF